MPFVTAHFHVQNRPVRKAFVEHVGPLGVGSLGWTLTDDHGSFTFDAGPLASRIDVKLYCQNSVIRVLDGSLPVPIPIYQTFHAANGDTISVTRQRDHYRILNTCLEVYEKVWRQFRPYNRNGRGDFPLGRKAALRDTYADSKRLELSYPDQLPGADRAFVEPSGLQNSGYPLARIRHRDSDGRLFGEGDDHGDEHDPSLLPHELGHMFHFATLASSTRASIEGQYLGFLLGHASNPGHDAGLRTTPFVAFTEAAGIFSERFFLFSTRLEPRRAGADLREVFLRDELGPQTLSRNLVDGYVAAGRRNGSGNISPNLRGSDVEGAVYGAIYLDFATRVGLREAVGLVLDSNATHFAEFRQYIEGRGTSAWRNAIRAVATTWKMQ